MAGRSREGESDRQCRHVEFARYAPWDDGEERARLSCREPGDDAVICGDVGMTRQCGECQLCCKLLPMKAGQDRITSKTAEVLMESGLAKPAEFDGMLRDFDKPAGARCPHQRHHKGCGVYARRPFSCRVWNCRWLAGDDAADLSRPDRVHYVIDIMPDVIRVSQEGEPPIDVPAIQV